jgi:DNA polymerase I
VLEVILKEGDPKKAADIVKEVIANLREGKVPMSELVIRTQLRKGMDSYDIKSPEVAAARKAVDQGLRTKDEMEHTVIGYIITKHGSSVSEKAEIEGIAKDYDADYYINNQVIPSTMRILKELNFNEEELKNLGNQKKL